jgi:hypothetical protein
MAAQKMTTTTTYVCHYRMPGMTKVLEHDFTQAKEAFDFAHTRIAEKYEAEVYEVTITMTECPLPLSKQVTVLGGRGEPTKPLPIKSKRTVMNTTEFEKLAWDVLTIQVPAGDTRLRYQVAADMLEAFVLARSNPLATKPVSDCQLTPEAVRDFFEQAVRDLNSFCEGNGSLQCINRSILHELYQKLNVARAALTPGSICWPNTWRP